MVPGRLPSIATTTTCLQNKLGAAAGEGIFQARRWCIEKIYPSFCLLKVWKKKLIK